MASSLAADLLVLLHLAFIVFVVLGGLLVWRWWRVVFLHLPASVWGVLLEFNGWQCPLTPLEQQLRVAAGEAGYSGGFIAHYLLPVIYPAGLTPAFQVALGTGALLINLVIYGWLLLGKRPMLK
ncbi:MAG: DUF2784 domain-containing protein [Gammaproteobacteria bacterium]|nr:DUF2784 domain-containing protein [Gammaproteobacteria bacterium]